MGNESNVKKIVYNGATATSLGSVLVHGIGINRTLLGNIIVAEGSTAVANFATGTLPNTLHQVANGARYANFTITLATADDVTVFSKVA